MLAWIVVVDTLNFCFWHPRPEAYFAVEFEGTTYRGYTSLCALINRAMKVRMCTLFAVTGGRSKPRTFADNFGRVGGRTDL